MKKYMISFLLFLIAVSAFGYEKSHFDLDPGKDPAASLSKAAGMDTNTGFLSTSKIELSLLEDGYFTIGTHEGNAQETLDDNCQITFGHPYAMTSYPYFALDGTAFRPETYFYGCAQTISHENDTLKLTVSDSSALTMQFMLIPLNNGDSVLISLSLENIDSLSHDLGAGMVLDPALGKWGDGSAFINDALIGSDTVLQTVPGSIDIRERSLAPLGMGLNISFNDPAPAEIHLGNWFDIYYNRDNPFKKLYDLALDMIWNDLSLAPGETYTSSVLLIQDTPDFPDDLFIRTDIPRFFSIENDQLFPRSITPLVDLFNNGSGDIQDVSLTVTADDLADIWNSTEVLAVASGNHTYTRSLIEFPEIYEDRTITVSISAESGSQDHDQLLRTIFIPSSPFSDTGLVVDIDTLIYDDFPKVEMIFGSARESNGQPVMSLGEENIFLYEDGSRLHEFSMEKDTSGGTNQADIVFVLDVTGSMTEEINGVINNIVEFTDSLSYRGIDFRLGMVTFLDDIESVYDFTSNVQLFQQHVEDQYAHGGGGYAENSLDALMRAAEFNFRPSANRVVIWITDASYHINNSYTQLTQQDVVNEMLSLGITAHCIGNPAEQTSFYDPVVIPTGGDYFDINGNFKDILLTISRMPASGKYRISYYSTAAENVSHNIKLEIHYAGLGGCRTMTFTPARGSAAPECIPDMTCFPNPFNPLVRITVYNPEKLRGNVTVYNILGQKMKEIPFGYGQENVRIVWDASESPQNNIGSGVYLIKTDLYDQNGAVRTLPIQKISYMK